MTDARLPERWLNDRRIQQLSSESFFAFANALMWSVSNRTDGVIRHADLELIPRCKSGHADELAESGLLKRRRDGWLIADFYMTQTSKAQLERDEQRERNRERQARHRAKLAGQTGITDDVTRDITGDYAGQARPGQAWDRTNYESVDEKTFADDAPATDANGFPIDEPSDESSKEEPQKKPQLARMARRRIEPVRGLPVSRRFPWGYGKASHEPSNDSQYDSYNDSQYEMDGTGRVGIGLEKQPNYVSVDGEKIDDYSVARLSRHPSIPTDSRWMSGEPRPPMAVGLRQGSRAVLRRVRPRHRRRAARTSSRPAMSCYAAAAWCPPSARRACTPGITRPAPRTGTTCTTTR